MSPLTLDGVRYGDNIPRQKITQHIKIGSRTIANSRGLHPQAVKPVLLELAGQGLLPPAMKELMPKGSKNRLNRVAESRPEGARPQRMDGSAVLAPVLDRPQRLRVALEIARLIAMNPDPAPLTARTPHRPRKRITPAFFGQPLYIHPKIQYQ